MIILSETPIIKDNSILISHYETMIIITPVEQYALVRFSSVHSPFNER